MSQHRDPVVADALRRLDVPDHGPDFWSHLDHHLADERHLADDGASHHTSEEQDAAVLDLEEAPTAQHRRGRRNRTPLLALVAAAAIVVALVVGSAIAGPGGDDESQVDVADQTQTSVPDTSAPDVTPPPEEDTTATTVPAPTTSVVTDDVPAADAEAAAQAWLEELADADAAGAYALLDETSQALLTEDEFAEHATGLFEGAAAFAGEGIDRTSTAIDVGKPFTVVTFSGDVEREGMVETASYPVVVTTTGVRFTLAGPQLELDPAAEPRGSTLTSPLELLVEETADVWVWFGDGEPQPLAGRGQVAIDVEAAAGPGTHLVSLVAVRDGAITARTFTVVVP